MGLEKGLLLFAGKKVIQAVKKEDIHREKERNNEHDTLVISIDYRLKRDYKNQFYTT